MSARALSLVLVAACAGATQQTETPPPRAPYPTGAEPMAQRSVPPPPRVAPAPPDDARVAAACPVGVRGVVVTVADHDGGATLVFAAPGNVSGLRTQVHGLARIHNELTAGLGERARDTRGEGTIGGEADDDEEVTLASTAGARRPVVEDTTTTLVLTPSIARVEATDEGARLHFAATAGASVEDLRGELAQVAEMIQQLCAWGADAGGPDGG